MARTCHSNNIVMSESLRGRHDGDVAALTSAEIKKKKSGDISVCAVPELEV